MTINQALDRRNYMKPIRGFDNTLAFCEEALIQHIKNIYKDFENERPSARKKTRTNFIIPDKGVPSFRSYMDVREFLQTRTTSESGKALTFTFEDQEVKISKFGKPYFSSKNGTPDLTFDECGRFYKTLYNYKFMLEEAISA